MTQVTKMLETRTATLEQVVEELEALQRIINGAILCESCGSADVVPEQDGSSEKWDIRCNKCDAQTMPENTMLSAVELWARNGD
jgi:Zn finger protein HypA/HybF involved in hydrogenase expression